MATLEQRPFSRDYSGLINQSVLMGCIVVICVTVHEVLKRKRRGKNYDEKSLGSVESWQFGYLYQGRSWAKNPSPPYPQGWPLSWVKEVATFPESKLSELRGVDATLYCRFIRGCFWFAVLHSFTTTVILLPIHLKFSDSNLYKPKSMTRALISALVSTSEGRRLLWIHLVLLLWVSITWIVTLVWISKGAFRYRAQAIEATAEQARREQSDEFAPHPHPQHPFQSMPPLENDQTNKGLRLRTVMVTNIPSRLRSEKELKEYFEYYMSRPLAKPSIGLTSSTQPGLFNKLISYAINRARKNGSFSHTSVEDSNSIIEGRAQQGNKPEIERVTVARKMTELASLLDRREEMMRSLETAHIRLARRALADVQETMDLREYGPSRRERVASRLARISGFSSSRKRSEEKFSIETDLERASTTLEDEIIPEDRTELLIRTLGPFVEEFGMRDKRRLLHSARSRLCSLFPGVIRPVEECKRLTEKRPETPLPVPNYPTIWEALFSLPRSTLNAYQPLVHLNALFRERAVPAIDYYATKVNYLTALITEQRSKQPTDFEAVSTAFVTFAHPDDARRACKYLAAHPKNPLACLVSMAPDYEDLDWIRLMKQTYKGELMKDWIVDLGVWAFTIVWIIPVSILVGLVSINNIATVVPGLLDFLNKHEFVQELVQSLLPTVFTSLLIMLIPLLLLLIAKKAHTISTLSALHDRILTRYHKFLVANILVFFCVGVTALESFFTSWKTSVDVLSVVGESFPVAGPFYVGWFIFTIGVHGGFELILSKQSLPLFTYPITKRQITPRKRAVGIRPRTFNYYYWLPNHVLTVILTLVFAVLNPLLMPFVVVYYAVQTVIIKNQLLHVYAKNYEGNGKLILIRVGRYTLDGLVLAQVIFLGFVGVNKLEVHLGLTAVMIAFTVFIKILFTRICRAKFEAADIIEAHVVCGITPPRSEPEESNSFVNPANVTASSENLKAKTGSSLLGFKTWKLPKGFKFTYRAASRPKAPIGQHKPIPFDEVRASRHLKSWDGTISSPDGITVDSRPVESMPELGASIPQQTSHERSFSEKAAIALGRPPLVVPHEKHPAWDDSARLDRPYDNPYYIRPIANHLWLPRNPVGILDLDDTVDVFRALTSDPSLGQLGEWIEGGIALADLPSSASVDDLSTPDLELGPLRRVETREISGEEDILLPPGIQERADNIRKETDVDYAENTNGRSRRPSIITRRTSSSNDARHRSISQTRSKTLDTGFPLPRRTSSFMSSQSNSQMPSISQARKPRRSSTSAFPGHDMTTRSILGGQAPYSRSRVSFATSPPRPRTTSGTSTPVTTREVVINEVIAEEAQANESRLREEEQSQQDAGEQSTRSWLTAWMFSRVPWSS
ncbi:hypothetical protein ACEPAH_9036 [Sanghuangporus vaninii]